MCLMFDMGLGQLGSAHMGKVEGENISLIDMAALFKGRTQPPTVPQQASCNAQQKAFFVDELAGMARIDGCS